MSEALGEDPTIRQAAVDAMANAAAQNEAIGNAIGEAIGGIVAKVEESNTWEANRDALQAANNSCATFGAGRAVIPPGTYLVKDVVQDSWVDFYGPGATLRHPDGAAGNVIRARTYSTTGTIAAGSDTLTVASTTGIEPGSVLSVRGARVLTAPVHHPDRRGHRIADDRAHARVHNRVRGDGLPRGRVGGYRLHRPQRQRADRRHPRRVGHDGR